MIREALNAVDGVTDVKVSIADRSTSVGHTVKLNPDELVRILNGLHLGASLREHAVVGDSRGIDWRQTLRASLWFVQVFFFGGGLFLEVFFGREDLATAAYVVCMLMSGPLFQKAWSAILRRKSNVELLMAAAMVGSLLQRNPREAAMVGALVTFMDTLTWAIVRVVEARLSDSITVPPSTITLKGGQVVQASELAVGAVFIVRAGECILADGTVVRGSGAVDESRLTGEPLPVVKEKGSKVSSGSVLHSGFVEVRADSVVDASFQNRIFEMVKDAKNTQSHSDVVVERFASWYTPLVIAGAVTVALYQKDFTQFLVIIVAGCPCAILGAAPFVQGAALAVLANRHRLLIKDTAALESLAQLRWLGIDKTGTITTGKFKLVDLQSVSSEWALDDLHRWAAALESKDNHPLANSIVESFTGCVAAFGWDTMPRVTMFRREGGCGVSGMVDGNPIGVGNLDFLKVMDIRLTGKAAKLAQDWASRGMVLFITVDQDIGAVMLMEDSLRPGAADTIAALKSMQIKTVLLTGDKSRAAQSVAEATGMDEYHSGLLPDGKALKVLAASWSHHHSVQDGLEAGLLQGAKRGPVEVGFLGDGLNDCPALAYAHAGIALQEVGPQALVDASSAVLQGDIGELPAAITIARRTRCLVIANISLAVLCNALVIGAATLVGIPLWLSVVADNGSLLLVLANSLWPLTWRVPSIPDGAGAKAIESGGVVAFTPIVA